MPIKRNEKIIWGFATRSWLEKHRVYKTQTIALATIETVYTAYRWIREQKNLANPSQKRSLRKRK